ncbi:MAG: dihydrodipicolinate synthase family protein [Acidobacteriia bacterium]|nr:dihydrodipicolinate synthase family protein [Terriglobia bacterium]
MLQPEEVKETLRGPVAFAPTPFRRDNLGIDLAGFRRNMDYLAQNGIQWVCVAGFVGEYSALRPDEFTLLLKTAADVLKSKSYLIVGVGGGTYSACEAARAAQDHGADCIMVLPPYLVQPTPVGLVEHFHAISASTRIAVMIHSMPGTNFSPELVETVAQSSNVVAYKDESGDLRGFDETVTRVGDRLVYMNGKAEMMMAQYFVAGATSNATAIGNFDAPLALSACQAALQRDYQKVQELLLPKARPWYRLREKNRAYLISLTKASMELAGLCGGTVRPPLSEISRADHDELRALMERLNYVQCAGAGERR